MERAERCVTDDKAFSSTLLKIITSKNYFSTRSKRDVELVGTVERDSGVGFVGRWWIRGRKAGCID